MEIHIKLAGVQLGPYSERQVREYISEGLLFPTDPARQEGTENWIAVNELLAKFSTPTDILPKSVFEKPPGTPKQPTPEGALEPTDKLPKFVFEGIPETPKRAPDVAPGVIHLPTRRQDTRSLPVPQKGEVSDKKTILIEPVAPPVPSSGGQSPVPMRSTTPLIPSHQKKVSGESLAKALAHKTAPLASRGSIPPSGRLSPAASATPSEASPPAPAQREVSKAPLSPLTRALSAKTAPMRSGATAAPTSGAPPAGRPITSPLPTKPAFKPASASVPPPPSVVKTLSSKLAQVSPKPPPSSPPANPANAETTKITSPRTKISEIPATPLPEETVDEPFVPSTPRKILPGLIYAGAAVVLLGFYYLWSPYHAASSLLNALDDGDPNALDAAIDFPSVRASLKGQVQSQLAQSPGGATSSKLLSMIDQSIDLYVSPEGISELIKRTSQIPIEQQVQAMSPEVAEKILLAFTGQPVKHKGLDSIADFSIDKDVAMLHLQFQGMGWKLKRVDLRPDLWMPAASGSALLLAPAVDTYLERGNAESKSGAWDAAIADFTQVLAIDPQSSVAYSGRGQARQSKGDLDGALKDFSQALTINPQMAAAFEGRGNVKVTKNDLDGAIADYSQAVHFDPMRATAYDSRGNVRTAKDDLDGAIADFTQAMTIDPNLASAYSDRGFARQANGNLDGAISDYTQAIQLKPNTANAYYNRGLARQSQGNLEAAIVDYDRALAFDPKIAGAYLNRGNAKNALHDIDGALADYTQAVTLNPKMAAAYCNRGLARQTKGDLDGAVADYTQALSLDPKIALAYYDRGLIRAQQGDFDGAIADTSQALYLDPKNVQVYYDRGFAKLAKGNLDGAQADMKDFCNADPKDRNADHARLYLWLISKARNAKADADQDLNAALESSWNSSPDDLVSKTAAFLLGRINEPDYLAAAVSPDQKTDQGQHCEAWYFAGMKRLLTGDKKGAIDAFHQCIATGQNGYCEYVLARAELQGLEAAPTPAPVPSGAAPATGAPAVPPASPAKSP